MLDRQMASQSGVSEFCQELYDKSIRSPYLLAFMVDMYEEQLEQQAASGDHQRIDTLNKATQVLK